MFKKYRRTHITELRPYIPGEPMTGISISIPDLENGSPMPGDMIARNPKNHEDQWLVAEQYFKDNFAPVDTAPSPAPEARQVPVITAMFEVITETGITGITNAPVKRVEVQDDGSYTVIIDYWPSKQTISEPHQGRNGGEGMNMAREVKSALEQLDAVLTLAQANFPKSTAVHISTNGASPSAAALIPGYVLKIIIDAARAAMEAKTDD